MGEMKKEAVIIGSGIAGIACAIRLANKGYMVKVFEKNSYPGGKLSEIIVGNYRFDAGPSLFTLPGQVDELFYISGKDPKMFFRYSRLPVTCKYFYTDGTILTAYADHEKLVQEITSKTKENPSQIHKALKRSSFLYKTLAGLFMHRSLHKPGTFFTSEAFRAYLCLYRLDFFRTMHQSNKALFMDDRLVQLFNRYATYNGSDPFQAPATLNIISHLEFNDGAYFPEGGMYSITNSLYNLALELGVEFHFNANVEKITIKNKHAIGVVVNGQNHTANKIISNMDMVNTYKYLLKEHKAPEKLLNQPKSSSALIFYWGIKKTFKQLDLHNIFFSHNYQKEFEFIFKEKKIFEDPTIYINITSKYKKNDAPLNCENWFTMINVPHNEGQKWDQMIYEARKNIISKLNGVLNEDIERLIEAEEVLDPRKIESKTSSFAGALYGNSSNNKYAAFLRHPNFSSSVKNLFFCGGSVHPGGGIPLCLLSAKITAECID